MPTPDRPRNQPERQEPPPARQERQSEASPPAQKGQSKPRVLYSSRRKLGPGEKRAVGGVDE